MKILTWNIACLPKTINLLRNPNLVIRKIVEKILNEKPNIICLQEVFDIRIRNQLEDFFLENKYDTFYSYQSFCCLPKNGLIIASNFPINFKHELNYNNKEGLEWIINKGVLTIGIQHPSGKEIIIHNTHMQSDTNFWYKSKSEACRRKQNIQLHEYLKSFKNKIQYLVGDLNDNFNYVRTFNYFDKNYFNTKQLITFPKIQQQLDYIISNCDLNTNYRTIKVDEDISDHIIFIAETNI